MRSLRRTVDKNMNRTMKVAIRDLYSRLEYLNDWRKGNVTYPLAYLLCCMVICLLIGCNDVKAMESALLANRNKVIFWLGKSRYFGIPSDTTLLWAIRKTRSSELMIVISEWSMKYFGEDRVYAIDGKAVRAALEKVSGRTHSPYILNAFASIKGYISAQLKITEKKNEVAVVRDLFKRLPMIGALITTDAFATYPHIIKEALSLGAHCLMPLKDNQPKMAKKAEAFALDIMEKHPELIEWYEDKDNNQTQHGRVEYRKTGVIKEGVKDLLLGTSFEGLISGVAIISRDRTLLRKGAAESIKSNQTLIYFFTDGDMTAEDVAIAARGHWAGCEIVHYVLDNEFNEDRSTIRSDYGMENMSALRKCVYGLLHWLKKEKKMGSYHNIRMMLRDLCGIIETTDAEYRKFANKADEVLRNIARFRERKKAECMPAF